MSSTDFHINPTSGVPIYRQLIEQVVWMIRSRRLIVGDALPSVREVATALEINPMTVSKAYSMLEHDGWLERTPGIGMFVAEVAGQVCIQEEALRPAVRTLVNQAREIAMEREQVVDLVRTEWSKST